MTNEKWQQNIDTALSSEFHIFLCANSRDKTALKKIQSNRKSSGANDDVAQSTS
jgi:hypothetical protein